jgi:hypothetical protein
MRVKLEMTLCPEYGAKARMGTARPKQIFLAFPIRSGVLILLPKHGF